MTAPDSLPLPAPQVPDLDWLRGRLLDQSVLVFGVLLGVTGALSLYRNLTMTWSPLVLLYLVAPVLFWLIVRLGNRLGYRRKAGLMLALLWVLVFNGLLITGPLANGRSVFILAVMLSLLFLGERVAWISLALGTLVIGLIGTAAVLGVLHFHIDYSAYVARPVAWVQFLVSIVAFNAIVLSITARLIRALESTARILRAQTAALGEAETRLRAALRRQRAMFSNSSSGIAVLSDQGIWEEVNPRLCELLDRRPADLIGHHAAAALQDPADFAALQERFRTGLRAAGEHAEDLEVRRGDGALAWVRASLSALDQSVPEAGALLVLVDIDRRKRAELALEAARCQADAANRAKTVFLAAMSHEIRAPMSAIIGLADLGLGPEPQARRRRHLKEIAHAARDLLAIIDKVLDLARIESGALVLAPAPFPLARVLARVQRVLGARARAKGLELMVRRHAGVPQWLHGDADRLGQVLINLCDNAVKFADRGPVTITLAARPAGDAGVWLVCGVHDRGPGLAPDLRGCLFEPFSQAREPGVRHPGGTGLGLYLVRRIVEAMDGRVRLRSRPGLGTSLRFTVRCARAAAPTSPAAPTADDAASEPRRWPGLPVLLVDDDPLGREIGRELLRALGLAVTVAADGPAALALLRGGDYRAVLLDIGMGGMDGFTVVRAIRADPRLAALPVIAQTAFAFAEDRAAALAAGFDEHLPKPIAPRRAQLVLARWLGWPPPARPARASVAVSALADDALPRGPSARVLGLFAAAHRETAAALDAALAQGEVRAAADLLHRLRGAAANLGDLPLQAAATALERALLDGGAGRSDLVRALHRALTAALARAATAAPSPAATRDQEAALHRALAERLDTLEGLVQRGLASGARLTHAVAAVETTATDCVRHAVQAVVRDLTACDRSGAQAGLARLRRTLLPATGGCGVA